MNYSNRFISIYDFKKQQFVSRNVLLATSYYWYCGADTNARFYFYRSTAVFPVADSTWKSIYTPHFKTGELQIYDFGDKSLTILEHPFPESHGEKPMWAFYVVQKDGTIYCDYILNDGHHVAKITPDWSSVEPYPEYTPTIFIEDWKNKE
jgi:hypothetical protein